MGLNDIHNVSKLKNYSDNLPSRYCIVFSCFNVSSLNDCNELESELKIKIKIIIETRNKIIAK